MIKLKGETFSKRGKKWGRPKLKGVKEKILKLSKEGKSYKEICKEVFYWDNNNHRKYVSIGVVHNILKEFSLKDSS